MSAINSQHLIVSFTKRNHNPHAVCVNGVNRTHLLYIYSPTPFPMPRRSMRNGNGKRQSEKVIWAPIEGRIPCSFVELMIREMKIFRFECYRKIVEMSPAITTKNELVQFDAVCHRSVVRCLASVRRGRQKFVFFISIFEQPIMKSSPDMQVFRQVTPPIPSINSFEHILPAN